jgi:hypothetical protein
MYDIIYSVTVHEAPECVIDLLENIFAYHPTMQVGVILNPNRIMYEQLKSRLAYKHVWLHPEPIEKQWCSYGIFLGHIENFHFLTSKNISANWYCLLASNCMFHRPISLRTIAEKYNEPEHSYIPTAPMPPIPEWPPTYQLSCNPRFFSFFHTHSIPFLNSYHEGTLYPWSVFQKIATFQDWKAKKSEVTMEFSFEEVLYASLHFYFTGKPVRSLCTMKHITIDTLADIQNPCIKTVPRIYDNEIRVWLRKDIRFYRTTNSLPAEV